MNIYYVYQYLRKDMTPYYIGKGKNNRLYEAHSVPIPPRKRIVKVAENLSEKEAFDLEIELIKFYGRKDLGTGILHNRTDGGDGRSGSIFPEERKKEYSERMKKINAKRRKEGWVYPDSARKTISEMQKGVAKPKEWANNVTKALNSRSEDEKAEWRRKISEAKKGKPMSEETKAKLSKINKEKHRQKKIDQGLQK